MFYLEIDISDVDKELSRLVDGPGTEDIIEFEAVLASQFQVTQQVVHVQTGSLRNSGKISSSKTPDEWKGEMVYGGPSVGFPHNPVKYAHYEQEREGSHDFMEPAYKMDDRYGEAVESWLEGRYA
jgi:hypothetical protein